MAERCWEVAAWPWPSSREISLTSNGPAPSRCRIRRRSALPSAWSIAACSSSMSWVAFCRSITLQGLHSSSRSRGFCRRSSDPEELYVNAIYMRGANSHEKLGHQDRCGVVATSGGSHDLHKNARAPTPLLDDVKAGIG